MSDIRYTTSLEGITPEHLQGLHDGWPNPPSPETHLASLRHMNARVLAVDDAAGQVAGFICGMSDDTLLLYIWDLEVRQAYTDQEIERELLQRLLAQYAGIYQVNVVTDVARAPLFTEAGFAMHPTLVIGMTITHIDAQDGGRLLR